MLLSGRQSDWKEESLVNICPCCFDFSRFPGDESVAISVDGNMQNRRFKDINPAEYEVLPAKMFVDLGRRNFRLAPGSAGGGVSIGSACGHIFKATAGWSKPDTPGPGKAKFDELGLVGAVCMHGTSLHYINIFTGERQTHVTGLLQNILTEKPDIKRLRLCYDVACTFGPAIKRLMPDHADMIEAKVGRFHIYGHGISCHTLNNLLRCEGWGLMVGEENEYDWSRLAHIVSFVRLCSGPRRTQIIDSLVLFTARAFKERMGRVIWLRYKRAIEVEEENQALLDNLIGTTIPARTLKNGEERPGFIVTIEYLMEQAVDQEEYYRNYK